MKILITGAGGFVARAVAAELEKSHELRLTDRCRPEDATVMNWDTGKREASPLNSKWPYLQAELTDPDSVQRTVDGMDAVVHLAANPQGFPEQGVEIFHANAHGTFVILNACRKAGVRRFGLASSINAYGLFYWRISKNPPVFTRLPIMEDMESVAEDPYSLGKLVGEITCAAFHRAYGITTAAFRFAGVWSDKMCEDEKARGLPPTKEWPEHFLQWVHVKDIARGIRQALEQENLPGSGVYNLCGADTRCPEPTMEILNRLRPDLAGLLKQPLKGREPLISIEKARRTFGYSPQYRLGP